ncbi:sugar kinase [Renibacterium salmoninarum]|nr:sugar kinase [Renibacterium salmoninarum]
MRAAVCLGETMAVLSPDPAIPVKTANNFRCGVGGAESNVAMGLAALGMETAWVSRVGDDGFGHKILDTLADHQVNIASVQIDPHRPTGLYFKGEAAGPHATPVLYHRRGSAAAAMSAELLAEPAVAELLAGADLIHLSGITPALSSSCRELCASLLSAPRNGRIVSFDLNWHAQLWRDQDPSVLRDLANLADVVLLGEDEAQLAFGTGLESELRQLLPKPRTLVIKKGAESAVSLHRTADGSTRYEVSALRVELLELVGAGDSSAAGYLSGLMNGLDERSRLRRGHLAAACTLTVPGDRGPLPSEPLLSALLACSESEEDWTATLVHPDGITSPVAERLVKSGQQ